MKRILTSTLILMALMTAAPAQAQISSPPGTLNQSRNTLIAKFSKLGFVFGKGNPIGNGFGYYAEDASTLNSVTFITVKTGVAYVTVSYFGQLGAAPDAPENHLAEFQKALKILLPNWKDGAAWLQGAQNLVVTEANAGVDSSMKEAPEGLITPLVFVNYQSALQPETNAVSYSLTVANIAQMDALNIPATKVTEPVVAEAAPTAAPLTLVAPSAPAQAPVVAQPQPQPAPAQAAAGCDPSYPTICIPAGSPDLDCPDISERRFQVLPPDPHRFDGDHDGIGCEK